MGLICNSVWKDERVWGGWHPPNSSVWWHFCIPRRQEESGATAGVARRCFSLHFAKGMRMQVIGSRSEGHIDVTFCKWWPSRIKCINFPDTCQWLSVTIMLCHWPYARMASCDCSMRAPPCLSSWSRLAERCARGHGTMMEDCTWWNEWSRWTYELPWDLSIIEHLQIKSNSAYYIPKYYPNSTVKPLAYSCFMFHTPNGFSRLLLPVSHEAFLAMTQIQSLGMPWLIMIVQWLWLIQKFSCTHPWVNCPATWKAITGHSRVLDIPPVPWPKGPRME